MLTTYFKHPFTLQKLRSGPAGLYLDDYASHLTRRAIVGTLRAAIYEPPDTSRHGHKRLA